MELPIHISDTLYTWVAPPLCIRWYGPILTFVLVSIMLSFSHPSLCARVLSLSLLWGPWLHSFVTINATDVCACLCIGACRHVKHVLYMNANVSSCLFLSLYSCSPSFHHTTSAAGAEIYLCEIKQEHKHLVCAHSRASTPLWVRAWTQWGEACTCTLLCMYTAIMPPIEQSRWITCQWQT